MKKILFIFYILSLSYLGKTQNIYTFAGTGNPGYSGDGGSALLANIEAPTGIVIDKKGNTYFCEWYYGLIRKIDKNGIITTIAGGVTANLADNIPATGALVRHPWGLTIDSIGNLYFAEAQYNQVRKIDTSGIITTIAGIANMTGSFSGDGGLAKNAGLNKPGDVCLDKQGNIYIADALNHRIRKVDKNGIITTFAGGNGAGYSGDGGLALSAKLNNPAGLCFDKKKNLYISDLQNYRVRKIDSLGVITTYVGIGVKANSGDGGSSTLAAIGQPLGLYTDSIGKLYIVDSYFGTVRVVDSIMIITTIAGTGMPGYYGDGGLATLAQIQPAFITFDKVGNLYITDNLRVRIVCYNSCAVNLNEFNQNSVIKIYPNPTSDVLHIWNEDNTFENSILEVINYLGQNVLNQVCAKTIDVSKLPKGIYTLRIKTKDKQIFYSKFIKE